MAKTIKFNLICDGNSVRTLEDLRNNFSIEDVLEYYKSGLLLRWLKVRGFDDEYEKVKKIREYDDISLTKKLIDIFDMGLEKSEIEEGVCIFKYKYKREELVERYRYYHNNLKDMLDEYIEGYKKCVDSIIINKDSMGSIKATLKEISIHYYEILKFDYKNLFYTLYFKAPKAVFAMLTIDIFRKIYLTDIEKIKLSDLDTSDSNDEYIEKIKKDRKEIIDCITTKTSFFDVLKEILGDDLKEFHGDTEERWKNIEPKGKKFIILQLGIGESFARAAGNSEQKLAGYDVIDEFPILDGIDYMSNYNKDKLLYMEV